MHKSGYITIIGNPNVGKSTFLNNVIGEKISSTSSKAQTTRHRLLGILNSENYQMIFSDTPGVIESSYELHKTMMSYVKNSLSDSDLILYIVGNNKDDLINKNIRESLIKSKIKLFVIINKIDLMIQNDVEDLIKYWSEKYNPLEIVPISALNNFNIDILLKKIVKVLPNCPPYFPKDEITDRNLRFIISEIIREKIFKRYSKEVPYSTDVIVDSYKEKEKITDISCIIFVERESQKAILIGKNGKAIKSLGISSRKSIQNFINKKVFLTFNVKVLKNWRKDKNQLIKLGYIN